MLTLWTLDLTCLAVHTMSHTGRPSAAAAILYPIWFGRVAVQTQRGPTCSVPVASMTAHRRLASRR